MATKPTTDTTDTDTTQPTTDTDTTQPTTDTDTTQPTTDTDNKAPAAEPETIETDTGETYQRIEIVGGGFFGLPLGVDAKKLTPAGKPGLWLDAASGNVFSCPVGWRP